MEGRRYHHCIIVVVYDSFSSTRQMIVAFGVLRVNIVCYWQLVRKENETGLLVINVLLGVLIFGVVFFKMIEMMCFVLLFDTRQENLLVDEIVIGV